MKNNYDFVDQLKKLADEFFAKQTDLLNSYNAQSKPKEIWPHVGDKYEYISSSGSIEFDFFYNSGQLHYYRKEFNNVFRLGTAAKELAYLKFERSVRAKAAELNDGWVADWKREDQFKFFIQTCADKISIGRWNIIDPSIVRGSSCKSKEAAQALLDHFGADKFMAYATGGEL